jgi:hypothetical protein
MKVCPFDIDSRGRVHIFPGTSFVPPGLPDQEIPLLMIANATPSPLGADSLKAAIDKVVSLYPEDPSAGSPFGTGNQTFGAGTGFKRAAAISTSIDVSLSLFLPLSLFRACIHGLFPISWGYIIPSPTPILEPDYRRAVLRLHFHGSTNDG